MQILPVILSAALGLAGRADAGTDFGSAEQARALSLALVAIIDARGIGAAIDAMHDPDQPFAASRMGVNLFAGSLVIADNREPEMVAADFAEQADLTGAPAWPRIAAAADSGGDAVLEWYHYDTQAPYTYHCHSARAQRDDGLVMVCR